MSPKSPTNRSIKRLHLDLRNPRLGRPIVTSEKEAAERLMSEFGPKIIELAKSIAQHGLSPTESWAIVKEDGRYVVLEGNRRLLACRLLNAPEKAPNGELAKTFERIQRGISGRQDYLTPSCVVFERRADARYWIELKHHGAGNGEGTASWGPEMVYLDQVNNGGQRGEWNEFWYWLEEIYRVDPELVDRIQEARREQYTLMQRVYNSKVKELLRARLDQSSGKIEVGVDSEKIKPFIEALITAMPTRSSKAGNPSNERPVIDARALNRQEEAKKVLEDLWASTIGSTDVSVAAPVHPRDVKVDPSDDSTESAVGSENVPVGGAGAGKGRTARPTRRSAGRPTKSETHLYHGVRTTYMTSRVKRLLRECASLEISKKPETAAVMARVALELAIDMFIDVRSIRPDRNNNLVGKAEAVLRYLDPRLDAKKPDRPELSGTWAAIRTDEAGGHLIRDLHNCVHSHEFTAAQEMAERANRLLRPLLDAINDDLGKTRSVPRGDIDPGTGLP